MKSIAVRKKGSDASQTRQAFGVNFYRDEKEKRKRNKNQKGKEKADENERQAGDKTENSGQDGKNYFLQQAQTRARAPVPFPGGKKGLKKKRGGKSMERKNKQVLPRDNSRMHMNILAYLSAFGGK